MKAHVDIIVPVFGMVLVGWAIGRTRLLTAEGLRGLVNVTFYALFPALLFRSMAKVRLEGLELDIPGGVLRHGPAALFPADAARPRHGHTAGRPHDLRAR